MRRLDEDAVGPGRQISVGAAEGLVQAMHVARIGARQDEGVGFHLALCGRADLRLHLGRGDDVLAGHVAAALGRHLILEHDRRDAQPLVTVQHVHDVLDVAIAVVAVDEHRQSLTATMSRTAEEISPNRTRPISGRPQRAPMVGKPPVK